MVGYSMSDYIECYGLIWIGDHWDIKDGKHYNWGDA